MKKKTIIIIIIVIAILLFPFLIYIGILEHTSNNYSKLVTIKNNYIYELKINKEIIRVEKKEQWECIKAPCDTMTIKVYIVLNNKEREEALSKLDNNASVDLNEIDIDDKQVIRDIIKEDN